MHDPTQFNQPPDELTKSFWQAWREQVSKTPQLAHLLLVRGRDLLERFQHFYERLRQLPRPTRRRWQRQLGASLAGMALALALSGAPAAHAFPPAPPSARINGTDCDLADAIVAANTDTATGVCAAGTSGADTIELLDNVNLYSVNNGSGASVNGLPLITSEITIEGAGFTIARDGGAPQFRILAVEPSGDLTLNNMTISGGSLPAGANGGGIVSRGALTLNNSTISGNSTSGSNRGGGIHSSGTLVMNNSTVSGNSAGGGGGIYSGGTLAMNNSTVSGNSANSAGGIFNNGTGTLSNSTVSGNSANSVGGGIINNGTVTLTNSTVSGNSGTESGGIRNNGTGTLTNSTVTGNTANTRGGGIYNGDTLTLERSLITGNTAPSAQEIENAYDFLYSGTINSNNFSVFGHSGQTNAQAFYGFTPSGSDIIATSDGTMPTALSAILDTTLQVNAPGNTATHALVTGSPAVDAAPNGPATDQRGVARPQGCAFDIGAFEVEQSCVVNEPPIANAGPDQSVFRNDTVTVSGTWTDPDAASNNPYTWAWDLDGDALADDSGSANYGDTVARTTSFAVDGVAMLTFTVTDGAGATSSDTVAITVVNRVPVANDQAASTNEDTPLPITLAAADADNDTLTYSVLTLPANGTLSGTAPTLAYTPDPDFFGADSFTFQVNDGLSDSNIATVSIAVNAINDPALAADDTATTDEDTPVSIPVQGNDSAGPANENPALTTTAVTDPPNGTAVINPDGSITYTPDANFNGTDSFDYAVCDSDGACDTATVTVLVNTVNDPPTAVDDNVTTSEDTPTTFNVLANDSDVDGNLLPGSVSVLSSPSNGALADNGNGSFTYTPAADFSGVDSFTYEVCDSDGVCASATVNITVTQINDAPVCTNVTPSVTTLWPPNHQFVPVTVSGATDIEGDAITISVSSIFQDEPTNGTGDGDTPLDGQGIGSDTAQVRAERKGNGNGRYYHITIRASDGNGGVCTTTVQVSVPKNQGKKGVAVDDGPLYDSTQP